MSTFQPPPTYTLPIEIDEATQKATFSRVWLKWFYDLVQALNNTGVAGGSISHNSLTGLQGGTANQFYHLTSTQDALVASLVPMTGIIESTGNPAKDTAAPTQVFLSNVSGWKFAVGDAIYFSIVLPDWWKAAGSLTWEIHWYSPNTTAARFVQWQLDWMAIAHGETITAPGSSGTITSGDVTMSTVANTLMHTALTPISGASLSAGDHVLAKLSRIASAGTAPAAGDNPVWVHMEIEYPTQLYGAV